jgi:hypothetical protein
MNEKQKASNLALFFCNKTDTIKPNITSIKNSIKCVEEILKLECLTDEAWLNVPNEFKTQYWKKVIIELNSIIM